MKLTVDFYNKVLDAIVEGKKNYGGTQGAYAKTLGIDETVYSRLLKRKEGFQNLLRDSAWITIARKLQVNINQKPWKIARTDVYNEIEKNILFCKKHQKSMILADECGIGKTVSAKHIIKNLENAFYLDCSQCKNKRLFIKKLAQAVGSDNTGKSDDVKEDLKTCLNVLVDPIIILDEVGDLTYDTFLDLKELHNGTACAWYLMGADALRNKMQRGITNRKVGYAEIFSRFSEEFIRLSPTGKDDRQRFWMKLIGDVTYAQIENAETAGKIAKKLTASKKSLRYIETELLLKTEL